MADATVDAAAWTWTEQEMRLKPSAKRDQNGGTNASSPAFLCQILFTALSMILIPISKSANPPLT